jgi:hypothetical protein
MLPSGCCSERRRSTLAFPLSCAGIQSAACNSIALDLVILRGRSLQGILTVFDLQFNPGSPEGFGAARHGLTMGLTGIFVSKLPVRFLSLSVIATPCKIIWPWMI